MFSKRLKTALTLKGLNRKSPKSQIAAYHSRLSEKANRIFFTGERVECGITFFRFCRDERTFLFRFLLCAVLEINVWTFVGVLFITN